ncbi:dehydrodolichyl diphosphate synthase 6 [Sesamum indicum]|uniref:Alkyl transferase n=1 Tax=Sesamum indicum TaxID=4182 RepID=A0A6I9TA32_SESIN|nr:dehydrodolichyl diphosphate synthase 6 [Sesamum indicum]XP_011079181.1 dehydrodolichyl diphosphate synthase 6 [Sesamum indicum]XP_020547509.1 dehydrodolichyl diphosphate synthase 6 [Sesamum indicum]
MDGKRNTILFKLFGSSISYMRRCLFSVLSVGPVPNHLAFILDGNRRYAKKWNLGEGMGYRAGFLSLMSLIKYCYELGVKYVSIYAFSIDNFRRRPEEVQCVMDLMLEKIEGLLKEESLVNQYGVRVYFIGNLKLLHEPVRLAAERAMKATSNNNNSILLICVAYTSTDEIVHAAQESCEDKWATTQSSANIKDSQDGEEKDTDDVIKLSDIESHMYMRVAPDPDILVRTSGETRLSNFLLWQTSNCLLYSPKALWPEIGLRHLVWGVLNFQRAHPYLERGRKQP